MTSAQTSAEEAARKGVPARDAMTTGTVTFLDVLGWKGIWLRRDSQDVVSQLTKLVERAQRISRGANETNVLSISDTIVLLTPGDPQEGLNLHGEIVVELICDSIVAGLPIRGATTCGDFYVEQPSILVGAAVDEAASWHEATDWIGVIQTPSAFLLHDGGGPWRKDVAPLKEGGLRSYQVPCADWPSAWRKRGYTKRSLQEQFAAMGPFDTAVAAKYTNAVLFYGNDPVLGGQE